MCIKQSYKIELYQNKDRDTAKLTIETMRRGRIDCQLYNINAVNRLIKIQKYTWLGETGDPLIIVQTTWIRGMK